MRKQLKKYILRTFYIQIYPPKVNSRLLTHYYNEVVNTAGRIAIAKSRNQNLIQNLSLKAHPQIIHDLIGQNILLLHNNKFLKQIAKHIHI